MPFPSLSVRAGSTCYFVFFSRIQKHFYCHIVVAIDVTVEFAVEFQSSCGKKVSEEKPGWSTISINHSLWFIGYDRQEWFDLRMRSQLEMKVEKL